MFIKNFINKIKQVFSTLRSLEQAENRRKLTREKTIREIIESLKSKSNLVKLEREWDGCTLQYKESEIWVDFGSREVVWDGVSVRIPWLLRKKLLHKTGLLEHQPLSPPKRVPKDDSELLAYVFLLWAFMWLLCLAADIF